MHEGMAACGAERDAAIEAAAAAYTEAMAAEARLWLETLAAALRLEAGSEKAVPGSSQADWQQAPEQMRSLCNSMGVSPDEWQASAFRTCAGKLKQCLASLWRLIPTAPQCWDSWEICLRHSEWILVGALASRLLKSNSTFDADTEDMDFRSAAEVAEADAAHLSQTLLTTWGCTESTGSKCCERIVATALLSRLDGTPAHKLQWPWAMQGAGKELGHRLSPPPSWYVVGAGRPKNKWIPFEDPADFELPLPADHGLCQMPPTRDSY